MAILTSTTRYSAPRRQASNMMLAACAAVALLQPLHAQDMPTPGSEPAELLADEMTRRTLEMMSAEAQPTRATLEVGATMLGLASELDPTDAERLRLAATLAETMNDVELATPLWSSYARLVPNDDAAVFKLVLARLQQNQTMDGRVTAIDKLVNAPTAEGTLTPALRSRLAWLAAEAAREMGDQPRYLTWLRQSARLDPTNAAAAAGVHEELLKRNAGPKSIGAAAKNWVEANPTDPQARMALASLLASEAVYVDASQQYANASRLAPGQPLPWPAYRTWALCLGAAGDQATALSLISNLERLLKQNALDDVDGDGELPVELELVRLTLLDGWDHGKVNRDQVAISESYNRSVAAMQSLIEQNVGDAKLQLAWFKAIFAPTPDEVEALVENAPGDAPLRKRALGWMHLRNGDRQWALDAFEGLESDPMAQLGKAMLVSTDDPGQARFLRDVVRSAPRSLAALIATQMLRKEGRPVQATPEGDAVRDLMQRTPAEVWRMDLERSPWILLEAEVTPRQARPFEPVTLNMTLTNNGPMPIAIGPDQALKPLAFVDVALFRQGTPAGQVPTQVVDIGRRLRLLPGESMTIAHRLDWSALGGRFNDLQAQSEAYAVSILIDPKVEPDGRITVGPFGTSDTLRGMTFSYDGLSDASLARWLSDLSADSPRPQMIGMARLASMGGGIDLTRFDPVMVDQATDVLVERAASLDPVRMGWLLWHLNDDRPGPTLQRVFDAAQRSESELVRSAYLVQRVTKADDPALIGALRSSNTRMQQFAESWAARLTQQQTPTLRP